MKKTANPMSMSPAVQNAQMDASQQPPADKQEVFKKLFSDKAYNAFVSRYPFLNDYIANFKVISANVDEGYAVGAFFLTIPNSEEMLMVPIVLKNNSIQPLMFIYSQKMDLFMPLSQEWLDEILKKIQQNPGEIVKPNLNELHFNDNISSFSHLPRTQGINTLIHKLGAEKVASKNADFLDIVEGMGKEAKETLKEIMQGNEKISRYVLSRFPIERVKKAFHVQETKVAVEVNKPETKEIVVATAHTPLDTIKKEFGKDHVVMDDIALNGYHIKDNRDTKNKMVVFTEYLNTLENPSKSGVYEIYLSAGKMVPALIIQDPIVCGGVSDAYAVDRSWASKSDRYKTYEVISAKNQCMVILPKGDYAMIKNDNIMATPTVAETIENSPVYKTVYGDKTEAIPLNKPFMFIKKTGNGYIGTGPIVVKTKVDEGNAIRCSTNYGEATILYTKEYTGNTVYVTKNNTVIVPDSFKVLILGEKLDEKQVLGSMKTIMTLTNYRLMERGGKPVTIVKDDKSMYGIESNRPMTKVEAVIKVAREYDVNAKEVEAVLNEMDKTGARVYTSYVISKDHSIGDILTKEAQMPMGMMGQPQMGMGGMDPQMMQMMMQQQQMGMDPSMMQQQMPQQMQQPVQQQGPASMQMQQGQAPQMQGQMDPAMAQQMMGQGVDMAGQMQDDSLFDASALTGLSYISHVEDLFPKYLPNLVKAMDSLGRIILNFWMNSETLQEEIGIVEYGNIEMQMRTLFENLGNLLLDLNKKVNVLENKDQ